VNGFTAGTGVIALPIVFEPDLMAEEKPPPIKPSAANKAQPLLVFSLLIIL
jgi:hypothetical protein